MENGVSTGSGPAQNRIPVMSMNERLMNIFEESVRSGKKIEFIPFKKWQTARSKKQLDGNKRAA